MNRRLVLVVLASCFVSALITVVFAGFILEAAVVLLLWFGDHHAVYETELFIVLSLLLTLWTAAICQWRGINLFREEKKP